MVVDYSFSGSRSGRRSSASRSRIICAVGSCGNSFASSRHLASLTSIAFFSRLGSMTGKPSLKIQARLFQCGLSSRKPRPLRVICRNDYADNESIYRLRSPQRHLRSGLSALVRAGAVRDRIFPQLTYFSRMRTPAFNVSALRRRGSPCPDCNNQSDPEMPGGLPCGLRPHSNAAQHGNFRILRLFSFVGVQGGK
jgi:hypothetical protein